MHVTTEISVHSTAAGVYTQFGKRNSLYQNIHLCKEERGSACFGFFSPLKSIEICLVRMKYAFDSR